MGHEVAAVSGGNPLSMFHVSCTERHSYTSHADDVLNCVTQVVAGLQTARPGPV